MIKKHYNPKSYSPSVYIPCWLLQVSTDLISHSAKILYGRLAQWSNEKGKVHRSTKQLSAEIGCPLSTTERYLKELRDIGLIGTSKEEYRGVNHFKFYEHEWMYEPIVEELSYKMVENNISIMEGPIPSKMRVNPLKNEGPIPSKMRALKYKEIKEINNTPIIPIGDDAISCKKIKDACTMDYLIQDLKADNPHDVPVQMLEDFLFIRKKKKAPITRTAWNRINKTLTLIHQELRINPVTAFETMVANNWQSIDIKYFRENDSYRKKDTVKEDKFHVCS